MKRKRKPHAERRARKRQKTVQHVNNFPTKQLLLQYYPQVVSLRHYLASKLSLSSKKRQKRLLHYGQLSDTEDSLAKLLDTTIVGSFHGAKLAETTSIEKDITLFTQQLSESTATITPTQGAFNQSEVGSIFDALTVILYPLLSHSAHPSS